MTLENDQSQKDERAATRLEELNEWLPVTSSRKANWWYSAFHNVTAMVGAGVLGLPYAMSQLGCVDDNVLLSLEKPAWLVATANMFVVIHVIGSYQVFAQPVFDMIQAFLVLKMNFKPTGLLRFVARISYVGK
ncbi:hypothetical protein C3L33_02710, partial [Rhododendron williamsianum]